MRYLVRARVRVGQEVALLAAIEDGALGRGSVAEGEYVRNMQSARHAADGNVRWVEVCYCPTPLAEEQPYWEEYFKLIKVQGAPARHTCRDENGTELWACGACDCTRRLEARLACTGRPFLTHLREEVAKRRSDAMAKRGRD